MNAIATNYHSNIPVIDIGALVSGTEGRYQVAADIGQACREYGFFYIVEHGVSEHLQHRLEELSRNFFAQDIEAKLQISMSRGGRAWRGYFPIGGGLAFRQPRLQGGIFFGAWAVPFQP